MKNICHLTALVILFLGFSVARGEEPTKYVLIDGKVEKLSKKVEDIEKRLEKLEGNTPAAKKKGCACCEPVCNCNNLDLDPGCVCYPCKCNNGTSKVQEKLPPGWIETDGGDICSPDGKGGYKFERKGTKKPSGGSGVIPGPTLPYPIVPHPPSRFGPWANGAAPECPNGVCPLAVPGGDRPRPFRLWNPPHLWK